MRRLRLPSAILVFLSASFFSCSPIGPDGRLSAPNAAAPPIDQLILSSNACGPAALLYSFSAGSEPWRRVSDAVPGKTDRERLVYVMKRYALQPSRHFRNQRRWSKRGGIGAADLADMAADMAAAGGKLSAIRSESLIDTRGDPAALLRRLHKRLSGSLRRGLPPILAVKRMAKPKNGGPASWAVVEGHYLVVTSLPGRLRRGATSFGIDCVDPNGGKRRHAMIRLSPDPAVPWLAIDCPGTPVGRRRLHSGQISHVTPSAVIGKF
jgi:hypothetical protein